MNRSQVFCGDANHPEGNAGATRLESGRTRPNPPENGKETGAGFGMLMFALGSGDRVVVKPVSRR